MTRSSNIDPGTAAFLSFLIPGLGQLRQGKTKVGLIWMLVVLVGYFLRIIPGLIFHILCILDAYFQTYRK